MRSRNNRKEFLLQLEGCLDSQGGKWLQQQLDSIAPRRYKLWVIDLSGVEFIDSFGLASLIAGLNTATQSDARFVLCGLRPSAKLIFEITQLDRVFTIFETYSSLIDSLEMTASFAIVPTLEAV